jgi:hypothetical protein
LRYTLLARNDYKNHISKRAQYWILKTAIDSLTAGNLPVSTAIVGEKYKEEPLQRTADRLMG